MKDKNNLHETGYNPTRRNMLSFLGLLPFAPGLLRYMGESPMNEQVALSPEFTLPAKNLFAIKGTYINAAYTHPMSIGSAESITSYLDFRQANGKSPDTIVEDRNTA